MNKSDNESNKVETNTASKNKGDAKKSGDKYKEVLYEYRLLYMNSGHRIALAYISSMLLISVGPKYVLPDNVPCSWNS